MSRTERVVVMSPQTRLARSRPRGHAGHHLPSLDAGSAERARAQYRAQRRPAVLTLVSMLLLLGGLPLLFRWFPVLDAVRLGGVPVSWLLLGVLPFPVMAVAALRQLRRAESIEDGG